MTQPKCVCDLCDNGSKNKQCYVGGIDRCIKNGTYTLFTSRLAPIKEKLYALSQGALNQAQEYLAEDNRSRGMYAIRLGESNAYRHALDCIESLTE